MTKTSGNKERPLPDGWEWTTVEKIFEIIGGGTPSTRVQRYWDGDIPWISSADIDEDHKISPRRYVNQEAIENSATNLVPSGSLIVVTRVGLGKVAIADEDLCFSQDSQALINGSDKTIPKYALYYLSLATQEFKHISRGTTIAGVTKKQLRELEFPLPPLSAQERIVAEIEKQFTRLDTAVATLHRLQANLDRYKASVLKAACEGRLVPQDPNDEPADQLLQRILTERRRQWQAANPGKKYKEPKRVEETAVLPDLPEGWAAVKLEQIILSVQTGPFGSSLHKSDYVEDGIPVINPASIIDGKIKPISRMAISEDTRQRLKSFILKNGDVIMGRRGEMGRSAMITEKEDGWLCGTGSLILRFAKPISRQYLVYLFGSESVKAYLGNESVGTTMQNLNQKILLHMVIGLPPHAEQERIVAEVERRLSVVAATQQAITANLARAGRLRQSILQQAFTGRLVPQQ